VNRSYDTDTDFRDLTHGQDETTDREISLSASTILGIFFALALLCAVFFGFGYSLGRRSTPPVTTATDSPSTPSSGAPKPSSGSAAARTPTAQDRDADLAAQTAIADQAAAQGQTPQPESTSTKPSALKTIAPPAANIAPPAVVPAAAPPSPAQIAAGQSVVQIAAVSHQEDADALQAALKAHGYNVFIRKEPPDNP